MKGKKLENNMIKNMKDIKNFTDILDFNHYKRGDGVTGEGIISEVVYVDDPVLGKAVLLFFTNGMVGNVPVELKEIK